MHKYLKIFQGYVSGSLNGRDDGQPEIQCLAFTDLTGLAQDPQRKDEIIYELVKPSAASIKVKINDERARLRAAAAKEERVEKVRQFEALKKELGK